MVQVIQRQKPTFGEEFGEAIGKGLGGMGASYFQGKGEIAGIKRLTGKDTSGLSPESRKDVLTQSLKGEKDQKHTADTFNYLIDEMEGLKEAVGPANISGWNPWSKTSGKRSQINTLRLSLEGLFRDLTLKGQFPKAIYESVLKELPSAMDTEEQYQNHLDAIRKILKAHFGLHKEEKMEETSGEKKAKGKSKFNPDNKEHMAKMKQLEKSFGGDRKKVNEALAREFE